MKSKSASQPISNPPIRQSFNLQSPLSIFLLLAILLLASFLRFYRLDAQSFWNDEGNSARIAERSLRLIVAGAAGDIHPPGYYLLLHYWREAAGHSEFALRAFSVFAGILAVAFTYALGRRLFGSPTGLFAAFLAALSPLAVYYSQEARMYALLGMLSAASTYLLLRVFARWRISESANQQISDFKSPISNLQFPLAVYILVAAAGLYTQYAFAFVLLVHNAIFALWWLAKGRRWRWVALWAGMQAAIVALYLPWLPIALRAAGWPSTEPTVSLGRALTDVLRVLTVGLTLPLERATVALVGAGVLLLLGLWPRRCKPLNTAIVAIYLLSPIALIFAFDLYKPAWLKFLVVVLPPCQVLIACGISRIASLQISKSPISSLQFSYLQSLISITVAVLVALVTLPSLYNLYFNPAYARDDYRQIAADVAALARSGDAVILNAPNQWEVFTYYYPDRDVYPAPYHPTPDQAETSLAPLTERYRRLFVLYWGDAESDPQRLIETWLACNAYKAADRWYGRVRLATYGVAALPEEPAIALGARLGDAIRLRGYALAGDRFAPGDVLPVTLFWEAEASPGARYKVPVQVLDAAGQLVAQHDGEPADGLALTDTWQPGQRVLDRHGVALPDDLSPGQYTLAVALYPVAGGARLPVTLDGAAAGDLLTLAGVEVEP
jgi:4-amino-4-deoxy-L-arabinose transferase-like glycosyltransferase